MLTQTPIIAQYLGLLLLTLLIHASYRATKPYNFYLREGFANYIFGVFLFLVFLSRFPCLRAICQNFISHLYSGGAPYFNRLFHLYH